jgi:hypothetical protein
MTSKQRGTGQPGTQGQPEATSPQRGEQRSDQQKDADDQQTQRARPTWGEQNTDKDQERSIGGGGTSSDSDGQHQ